MKDDLNHLLDSVNSRAMVRVLSWIVGIALTVVLLVFATYFLKFHGSTSVDQGVWGQFGDFIGGTLNPVLSFLSLIALVFTVVLQTRQLEHSREELANSRMELAATREEMHRATRVQRLAANAANEQARYANISTRLSALQAALAVATERLEEVRRVVVNRDTAAERNRARRVEELSAEIVRITDELLARERRPEPEPRGE